MKTRDKPLQAVGYVRVSSAKQSDEGISIDVQIKKIKQWASLHDAQLLNIFGDDGITGRNIKRRPGFQKALQSVLNKKAILVCYSLSRLSRSTKDMIQLGTKLNEAGAELVSLSEQIDTTTASGKMVFRMLAVLNEFESDQIGERTKAALTLLREQGKKTGGLVPYGYDVDESGNLYENEQEQDIIKKIMSKHKKGMKFQTISNWLNDQSIKTKTGKKWYAQSVKNVIQANTQKRFVRTKYF